MPSGRVADEGRRDKIVEMYAQGMTRKQISVELGVVLTTVTNDLKARGVMLRPVYAPKLTPEQEQELVARYASGEHRPALADAYSLWPAEVRTILDRHSAALRDDRGRHRDFTDGEIETIRRMAAEDASQHAIAMAVRSTEQTVLKAMQEHGIPAGWTGQMKLDRHYRWNGGRTKATGGYYAVRLDPSDPLFPMADSKGYALEHRVVMARKIGRMLEDHETVHHINGARGDNRDENLQLRAGRHGKGSCYRCLDCGSTNVVAVHLEEEAH